MKLLIIIFASKFAFALSYSDKDENNNSIEKVDIESKCAEAILKHPTKDMLNALEKVRKYSYKHFINNFDYLYFPNIILDPNKYPGNGDLIEFIEAKSPSFHNSNIEDKQDIFRKYITSILEGPVTNNIEEQMIFISTVGQILQTREYDAFMNNINIMRRPHECPGTPEARILRQPIELKYIYTGIYAISNSADAQALNLKKRKLHTINGINRWKPNDNNCFISDLRKAGLPAIAGPSGSMGPLMNAAIDAKLSPEELKNWRLLSTAFVVDAGLHSFAEALYSSDFFLTGKNYHGDFLKNYAHQIAPLKLTCPKL